MKTKNTQTINVNELQAKASKVIRNVEAGKTYKIMRYSKPVAVLVSAEEYECLTGECRGCVQDLVRKLKNKKR